MSFLLTIIAAQAEPVVAIVVVDQEARDQGYALQLDGWLIEDALPIDVMDGEKVHLVDADGRRELLDVAAGEAWEITGRDGDAWMSTLNDEVRTDLVAIRGDAEAIVDLATTLDVDLLRKGDEYYLRGASVLFDVPWVESRVASRIDEVRLVRVEDPVDAEVVPARLRRHASDPSTRPTASSRTTQGMPNARELNTVGPVPASLASVLAPPPVSKESRRTKPTRSAVAEPEPEPQGFEPLLKAPHTFGLADLAERRLAMMKDYIGLFDCRDEPLLLTRSGAFSFAGRTGIWNVSAPGVIHLLGDDGETWAKVAIDAEARHCRDAW